MFAARTGVAVEIGVCSRHCGSMEAEEAVGTVGGDDFLQEIADAGVYDLAIAGAEYLLDDGEVRGIIARRNIAIPVPKGNPKAIRRLEDLAAPGLRVSVSVRDCLRGVWENICSRAGLVEALGRNITFYANGCISIIEAVATGKAAAAVGLTCRSKPYAPPPSFATALRQT